MRWLSRFLGLWLAAGAFVALVIDGTRTIADRRPRLEPIAVLWETLHPQSLASFQSLVEADMSPLVWERIIAPALGLPVFGALAILAALFLFLGRRPRSRIGYAVRG